jgi:hypothetical protein
MEPRVETSKAPTLASSVAGSILDDALTRYAAQRRDEVPEFVRRTYGWRGAARLHRSALGWDLVRAPANLLLGGMTGMARLGGIAARSIGARSVGARLARVNVLLDTDVGREVTWRLHSDLLMIPYRQSGRVSMADALFEEILKDPRVTGHVDKTLSAIAAESDARAFQHRFDRALRDYIGARAPATDITAAFMTAAIGYAAYHKATPGLLSLSSTVAASLSHSLAVSSFWAGSAAGSVYYGLFGAPAASGLLTAGVFAGLAVPAAALTALAGMVSDPVQVATGAHQRRLVRLIDTLETNLKRQQDDPLPLRSHYIARLTDVWDWTAMAYTLTRRSSI